MAKGKDFPKVYMRLAHECEIIMREARYLQSYTTVVVRVGEVTTLDPKWECSRTTVAHVAKYLDETPTSIRAKLGSGVYAIEDLN